MLIKLIEGSTRQLGAPADWDGKDMSCDVLPILDVQTAEGNFMYSAWEPTPPELEALNKGANIVLGVRGAAHPVVSLQVAADVAVKHPDDVAVDQFAEVMKAKLADARTKGRSGWQECDPAELSYMLREHVEKGDPRDVANFCMFLWSLGKPIGDARPVVNLQLTPLDGIQVWIDAYTNAANGLHFMGHGRIVQLLREYLALRKLLAQRTPPPLPETHYNGSGDGSEPLYTADMVHLYASQYAAILSGMPVEPAPFQQRVLPWMMACFGEAISNDLQERNHRFFEEATELVQSTGMTRSEAHQLVDYVYGRPLGEPAQEVGGVMVTLAALCLAAKMDMHAAGETELARIWTKVEQIRAKQAAKPKHSPLPIAQPSAAVAQPLEIDPHAVELAEKYAFPGALHPEPAVAQPVANERDAARWRAIEPYLQIETDNGEECASYTSAITIRGGQIDVPASPDYDTAAAGIDALRVELCQPAEEGGT